MTIAARRPFRPWLGLAMLGLSAIAACTPVPNADLAPNSNPETVQLTLVSYAVTQRAYEKIIPMFAEEWQAKTGQTVIVDQSYGGSGSQTRAVIDGLEADVVALALALDTQAIEQAGLIDPGWETEAPHAAIVTRSVVALVTRQGEPPVSGWADLSQGDRAIVTANPKTSGGARWNYLALWGAIAQSGQSDTAAADFVAQVYGNVPILPKNAREASDVFYKQGQGDILINYENEVLLAAQEGDDQPYTIPTDYNISVDNPIAVVDANVDQRGTRDVAEAFVAFLYTPAAQREFAKVGFRPVDETVAAEFAAQFPTIEHLFTVADLGGWDMIQTQFFDDGAAFDQMIAALGQR
ncbi:sulfate ABC transporter substrate-binding protein [Spirulina major CS-329]|uniref:sulfate ABC transporter substrate-binding protein n=1 Tax=Spirulina TaxID=1154 RepID=UPI0023303C1F|nr:MULTISPECIES: sulfate ABC transporter substrate-binding protein [Spirulina]MDB9494320.1 sulfate ABC transporter substrate-binding protein [Spirulina subsalsa CS-330]MDB9502310.1 sulfate ABC transporter substrate-binding protein [Spirulina major CS-329]